MDEQEAIPSLSSKLIEKLDQEIPHLCPSPGNSRDEIMFYAGKRALVDSLLSRLEGTEEEMYQQKVIGS